MLEACGVLKTWALPRVPEAGVEMECKTIADHRLAYLDYEGPVSGERGVVTRWDRGTYTIERQSDVEWAVDLVGEKLVGTAFIRRLSDVLEWWIFSFAEERRA